MMVISMLDYLIDKHMESVVSQLREREIVLLQQIFQVLCQGLDIESLRNPTLSHRDGQLTPLK